MIEDWEVARESLVDEAKKEFQRSFENKRKIREQELVKKREQRAEERRQIGEEKRKNRDYEKRQSKLFGY